MFPCHGNNQRVISYLHHHLKTTCISLGLARLQIDVGLPEEARRTLASLQDDFQLLLSSVEEPTKTRPLEFHVGRKANRISGKHDPLALNEELTAVPT